MSSSDPGSSAPAILWRPAADARERTDLGQFWDLAEHRSGRDLPGYAALHRWSVDDREAFWGLYAEFSGIEFTTPADRVHGPDRMPGTEWFPGARLNYAANILQRRDDRSAIIARSESGATRTLTFAGLYDAVSTCAAALRAAGVVKGDRVAAFMANVPETVIAFLATASIGAIWSSCSPDFGAAAAADRLGQIEPRVLFANDRYLYGAKEFDCRPTVRTLLAAMPAVEVAVLIPYDAAVEADSEPGWIAWTDFTDRAPTEIDFAPLPFDHPLYILYSSGTTGPPKCMVHGAGGTLIQHRKEHQLHTDLHEDDVLLYVTTCGWMMWNWLVSALAGGTTIVLYDGSPGHPDLEAMWRMTAELGITVFGTSAPFIEAGLRAGLSPRVSSDLSGLRAVLSTGAPLSPAGFRWTHEHLGEHVQMASISGGTDIVSCFVLGNPLLPVYEGEIQCVGLGLDVVALDEDGQELVSEKGELVCRRPFPAMPVAFWNDPDGDKYRDAYFAEYPGMWRHGDFVEITARGTVIIYGRSDATLKPSGVRIGTAEIYRPLQGFPWIAGAVASAVVRAQGDEIVLFVQLAAGENLTDVRIDKIRATIRREASPRHVPHRVMAVSDIPRTRNGKVAEAAVARMLRGDSADNRAALANPECLDEFVAARQTLLKAQV
ncbi:MAG: acetoacetate--CoA ligase [Dehalococcoidia bacterium]|jgi:acetoacetyl-CoA synthetase|nr:acetoacetate--CoA ligase [Chloroflexota bacterium]MDP6823484.1 acetoacetate--CoA ligase [Dehalococcoidia bacterium]